LIVSQRLCFYTLHPCSSMLAVDVYTTPEPQKMDAKFQITT